MHGSVEVSFDKRTGPFVILPTRWLVRRVLDMGQLWQLSAAKKWSACVNHVFLLLVPVALGENFSRTSYLPVWDTLTLYVHQLRILLMR